MRVDFTKDELEVLLTVVGQAEEALAINLDTDEEGEALDSGRKKILAALAQSGGIRS